MVGDGVPLLPESCASGGAGISSCGPSNESCCTSNPVPTGTYSRTYTNNGTEPTAEANPATVTGLRMDKYLVTVGRFRRFVNDVLATDAGAGWSPLGFREACPPQCGYGAERHRRWLRARLGGGRRCEPRPDGREPCMPITVRDMDAGVGAQ
jgi:hypothetical protein